MPGEEKMNIIHFVVGSKHDSDSFTTFIYEVNRTTQELENISWKGYEKIGLNLEELAGDIISCALLTGESLLTAPLAIHAQYDMIIIQSQLFPQASSVK